MKRLSGLLLVLALISGLAVGLNPFKTVKTLDAAAPEKIGIYTNSFGYYVYVADPINNRVLKYSTDGLFLDTVIKTVTTHSSGEKWELKKVVDIVTCRLTDVIGVADAMTGHSYIYEMTGHSHHKNGKPGNGKGELQEMWGVAMTETNETKSQALLDRKGCKVSHWNPPPGGIKDPRDGLWVRDFGGKGTGDGQLMFPEGMAYDKKQNLWVADTGNGRVVEFDLKGKFIRNLTDNMKEPCAVGFDFLSSQGNKLYVLDRGTKTVHVFSSDIKPLKVIKLAGMDRPSSMTIDCDNNIWVTDVNLNKAFKYNQAGKQLLVIDKLINPVETKRTIVRVFINKYIMTINDVIKAVDAPPFIQSGKTLVPLKAISEGLGAKVDYNGKIRKGQITVRLGNKVVVVWIGETKGTVDGKTVTLEVPPMIKKGRTFVPVRFISEGLGCQVNWNPKDLRYSAGAVTVIYPK
jgi:DNA-binding beta-propeller fold protein YncE